MATPPKQPHFPFGHKSASPLYLPKFSKLWLKLVTTQEKARDVWGKTIFIENRRKKKITPWERREGKRSSRDHKWPLRRKDMYRTQKKPDTDENHARGCVPNYVLWQAKASKLVTTQEKARDVWGKTIFIENRRKKKITPNP